MKKFLVSLLAVFYLGVSSGATVQLHYCMGRLINWSLSVKQSHTCDNCGMKKTKAGKCCKDELKQIKLHKTQIAPDNYFSFKTFPSFILNRPYAAFETFILPASAEILPAVNGPPGIEKTPVFIKNCTFRI